MVVATGTVAAGTATITGTLVGKGKVRRKDIVAGSPPGALSIQPRAQWTGPPAVNPPSSHNHVLGHRSPGYAGQCCTPRRFVPKRKPEANDANGRNTAPGHHSKFSSETTGRSD